MAGEAEGGEGAVSSCSGGGIISPVWRYGRIRARERQRNEGWRTKKERRRTTVQTRKTVQQQNEYDSTEEPEPGGLRLKNIDIDELLKKHRGENSSGAIPA